MKAMEATRRSCVVNNTASPNGVNSPNAYIEIVNNLLRKYYIDKQIAHLTDCSPSMFIVLYEHMFRERIPGIERNPQSTFDHLQNLELLIAHMKANHIQVSSNIRPYKIYLEKHLPTICNFISLFDVVSKLGDEASSNSSSGTNSATSSKQVSPRLSQEHSRTALSSSLFNETSSISKPPEQESIQEEDHLLDKQKLEESTLHTQEDQPLKEEPVLANEYLNQQQPSPFQSSHSSSIIVPPVFAPTESDVERSYDRLKHVVASKSKTTTDEKLQLLLEKFMKRKQIQRSATTLYHHDKPSSSAQLQKYKQQYAHSLSQFVDILWQDELDDAKKSEYAASVAMKKQKQEEIKQRQVREEQEALTRSILYARRHKEEQFVKQECKRLLQVEKERILYEQARFSAQERELSDRYRDNMERMDKLYVLLLFIFTSINKLQEPIGYAQGTSGKEETGQSVV